VAAGVTARGRLVAGLVAGALVVTAAGCANGTEDHPVRLRTNGVPFGLLAPSTTTIATTTTAPVHQTPFVVYYDGPDGVVPAIRTTTTKVLQPAEVGATLLAGPTREEALVGMHTDIPSGAVADIGRNVKGTVTVDLSAAFTDAPLAIQKVALAQIVLTMTLLAKVTHVRILLDGRAVPVVRGNGTTTLSPLTRADYSTKRI